MAEREVVVVAFARTPFGRVCGGLKDVPAHQLGALAVDEVLRRAGIEGGEVDALYAGVGALTAAREVVLASQLPAATPSLAVNRAGCSGMTAIGLGWKDLAGAQADLVICGGYDSLSRSPPQNGAIADYAGEEALAHGVTRAMQDEWAELSGARYLRAEAAGVFATERFPVAGLVADELAGAGADGAAFLMLATADKARRLGLATLACIVDYAEVAGEPASESAAPAVAIRQLMKRQGRAMYEIDLLEIDEARAATPLVSTLRLGSRNPGIAAEIRARTNVNGGAVALGHSPGAGGARIAMTLVNALTRRGGGRGVAAICGGHGQSDALMVEVAARASA